MTKKDICVGLLPQYKIPAMKFLNNNKFNKKLVCNDDMIEVMINADQNECLGTKVINKDEDGAKLLSIDEISKDITDLIINIMKDKLLKEYILKQYGNAYKDDKDNIYIYSLKIFEQKEVFIRDTIVNRVYNYILNNNYINVDGFVKFRMKEFMGYISTIGDIALEEYLMEKDHEEFIKVLKYFVDIQQEKIELLRVHILDDNSFILYDKDGNKIENIDDEDIINMVIKENLNYEDFLISTLLTLCPKKIEIVNLLNDNCSEEIIETIKSIFGDRVKIILPN